MLGVEWFYRDALNIASLVYIACIVLTLRCCNPRSLLGEIYTFSLIWLYCSTSAVNLVIFSGNLWQRILRRLLWSTVYCACQRPFQFPCMRGHLCIEYWQNSEDECKRVCVWGRETKRELVYVCDVTLTIFMSHPNQRKCTPQSGLAYILTQNYHLKKLKRHFAQIYPLMYACVCSKSLVHYLAINCFCCVRLCSIGIYPAPRELLFWLVVCLFFRVFFSFLFSVAECTLTS